MSARAPNKPADHRAVPWWRGARGEYYVGVQAVIFALIAFGPHSWPGVPAWDPAVAHVASWVGLALVAAGAPLALTGLLALGRQLTALPYPVDDAKLVRTGAYAIVRHPIYAGLILMAFGWGLYRASWLVLLYAVALFVLFDLKSRREERWLAERFPEYPEYRRRVKKLLPWVY